VPSKLIYLPLDFSFWLRIFRSVLLLQIPFSHVLSSTDRLPVGSSFLMLGDPAPPWISFRLLGPDLVLFDSFFRARSFPFPPVVFGLAARLALGFLCAKNLSLDHALLHRSRPVISHPTHGLRSGAAGLGWALFVFASWSPLLARPRSGFSFPLSSGTEASEPNRRSKPTCKCILNAL
jgi:hypothetical protein